MALTRSGGAWGDSHGKYDKYHTSKPTSKLSSRLNACVQINASVYDHPYALDTCIHEIQTERCAHKQKNTHTQTTDNQKTHFHIHKRDKQTERSIHTHTGSSPGTREGPGPADNLTAEQTNTAANVPLLGAQHNATLLPQSTKLTKPLVTPMKKNLTRTKTSENFLTQALAITQ